MRAARVCAACQAVAEGATTTGTPRSDGSSPHGSWPSTPVEASTSRPATSSGPSSSRSSSPKDRANDAVTDPRSGAGNRGLGLHVEVGVDAPDLLVDLLGRAERGQPRPAAAEHDGVQAARRARERDERRVAEGGAELVESDQSCTTPEPVRVQPRALMRASRSARRLCSGAAAARSSSTARNVSTVWRNSASSSAATASPGGRTAGRRDATARPRSAAARTTSGRPDRNAIARSRSASRRPCTAAAVARSMLPKRAW